MIHVSIKIYDVVHHFKLGRKVGIELFAWRATVCIASLLTKTWFVSQFFHPRIDKGFHHNEIHRLLIS